MGKGIEIYKERLLQAHQSYDSFPLPDTQGTTLSRESIQVLKYEAGQRYKWHTDQFPDTTHHLHNRSLSLVLYLTNNFSGGRTCLPHKCYKPRPGQALIFPSNWCFPHSAEPVERGTKIACVGWYHSHYNEWVIVLYCEYLPLEYIEPWTWHSDLYLPGWLHTHSSALCLPVSDLKPFFGLSW